eukprot:CAMPEP_0184306706 /NCGR_PEP_ID=MMETSP1049-20130417/15633_1 /TAXON_ID=77928 /ORGANISM="Proteomonas sulcata, Strain CCMP704" /LENGTH=95 /DNA_ID=CAMNT_0026619025 /DNA_START=317 /DNA_END=604 /DNA_ORIENTATION=-
MVTFGHIQKDGFALSSGSDKLKIYESSPGFQRKFCGNCGCHIVASWDQTPDLVYYTVGSLDNGAHPGHASDKVFHVMMGSKVHWFDVKDDVQKLE